MTKSLRALRKKTVDRFGNTEEGTYTLSRRGPTTGPDTRDSTSSTSATLLRLPAKLSASSPLLWRLISAENNSTARLPSISDFIGYLLLGTGMEIARPPFRVRQIREKKGLTCERTFSFV